jgi:endonuclease YncB( thermonuclease family)
MRAVTGLGGVLDFLAMHLPALWVAGAGAIGVATLTSLDERLPSPEVSRLARPVAVETARPFPLEIGVVERVIDGDTYDVRLDRTGEKARVRLAWMDAPERAQPFGAGATHWAETSLLGRRVVLTIQNVDPHGRMVAQLSVDGEGHVWDVGATLARSGLGWLDPRYGDDRESLREDQDRAKSEGIGLWAQPNPMPPWDWRRLGKAVESDTGTTAL